LWRTGKVLFATNIDPLELWGKASYLGHWKSFEECPMAMTNPLQFIQQVRAEVAKIVWPTRRETGITTIMVFVMATIFALFFFSVDLIVRNLLELVLL
jgi:preprotein translocase subunit SecE